jgi:hypothetical protein
MNTHHNDGLDGADNTDGLGDLLRTTFQAREDEVFDVTGLAAGARSGHVRRTTRRRQLTAVGAVGVLAVGGSSALALSRHGSGSGSGSPADNTAVATPSRTTSQTPARDPASGTTTKAPSTTNPLPEAGSRAWSSHGLQVRVPQAWKPDQAHCGTPTADTVMIDQAFTELCMIAENPSLDVVTFGTAKIVEAYPNLTLHPTTIGGHAAQTGSELLDDGRHAAALVVPDLDVSVAVTSRNADLVSGILATARIVATDADGCASSLDVVGPGGPPSRPGATTAMVPGKPVKAIICHYVPPTSPDPSGPVGPGLLASGSQVPADQLGTLTGLLNSGKAPLATWQGLANACTSAAHDGYLIRFSYASGAPVDVYLHAENCDHMGFDNGAVTGLVLSKFIEDFPKFMENRTIAVASEALK